METKEFYTGGIETSVYPMSFQDNECFRITDKDNNESERLLVSNYWRELINLYGQKINYYVNNFALSSADLLYGEDPLQKYSPPVTILAAINLNDNALMLSKYGLLSEDELTAFIHISGFYTTFGYDKEPKSGDVFQLVEYGRDRPGGRDGKFFEITERLDEDIAQINALAGHYVWLIKAKRFETSFEPGLSADAVNNQVYDDTKNTSLTAMSGADKPYSYNADVESKNIFDYSKTDYSDVYGGYY
jgi:hypothetical protein